MKNTIDVNFSGTTAVNVLIRGEVLYCANTGDSRAILGRFNGKWLAKPLSKDHKPELEDEKMRIEGAGGRVEPYMDP